MKYVLLEMKRVTKLKEILITGDIKELGNLLDESHKDFTELYDGSVPEVEKLIRICKEAGSLGTKMTGLGWGGCVVSIVELSKIDEFIEKVENVSKYYIIVLYERECGQSLDHRRSGRLSIYKQSRAWSYYL